MIISASMFKHMTLVSHFVKGKAYKKARMTHTHKKYHQMCAQFFISPTNLSSTSK